MSRIFIFSLLMAFSVEASLEEQAARAREKEARLIQHWQQELIASKTLPDQEKLERLSKELRGAGNTMTNPDHSPEVRDLFRAIQFELLSTPGHAEYLEKQHAEARKKTDDPWNDDRYLMKYAQVRDTAKHLPSPETVWVFGHLLESDEDRTTTEERLAIVRRARKLGLAGDYTVNPRRLSGDVLAGLGIRNKSGKNIDWWQKVKTGELAFSFVGQSVEYRFNPDGTWETTPISVVDDPAPEIPGTLEVPGEKEATTLEAGAEEQPKQKPFWLWLAGLGVLLISISAWLGLKEKLGKAAD